MLCLASYVPAYIVSLMLRLALTLSRRSQHSGRLVRIQEHDSNGCIESAQLLARGHVQQCSADRAGTPPCHRARANLCCLPTLTSALANTALPHASSSLALAPVCLLTQTLILRQVGVLVSYNLRDCDRTHHYQLMRVQQGGCLDSKGKCDMGLCTCPRVM